MGTRTQRPDGRYPAERRRLLRAWLTVDAGRLSNPWRFGAGRAWGAPPRQVEKGVPIRSGVTTRVACYVVPTSCWSTGRHGRAVCRGATSTWVKRGFLDRSSRP